MELVSHVFKTLPSTNTWAKRHAEKFQKEALTLVLAHEQTEGRGRFGRKFLSFPGENFYGSFCFFSEKELPWQLGFAVAVAKSLIRLGGKPSIKWPNDILLNQKKCGGILVEKTSCFIVGVGINVSWTKDTPSQIDQPATALNLEGLFTTREELLVLLVEEVFALLKDGPDLAAYVAVRHPHCIAYR